MTGNIQSKVIILLDLENVLFGSVEGMEQRFTRREFVHNIVAEVRDIALKYGPIGYEYAAISVPPDGGETTSEIIQLVLALSGLGVSIILVPRGDDAADFALCQIGESILEDLYVNAIVLVTGDGHDPFLSFIHKARAKMKKVCVVATNKIPGSVRELSVDQILLAPRLRKRFLSPQKAKEEDVVMSVCNVGEGSTSDDFSPEVFESGEYTTFFDRLRSGLPVENMFTLLKVSDAMRILRGECFRVAQKNKFNLSYLEKKLFTEFRQQFPGISRREVKLLLFSLLNQTDFFSRPDGYVFNTENKIIRQVEAAYKSE
ncbi:MAG: hypothetical protein HZA35_01880 [Parcubacteria group bacterium]|nr:hypothetical protein [Parcubacteria group bacterium]